MPVFNIYPNKRLNKYFSKADNKKFAALIKQTGIDLQLIANLLSKNK